MHVSQKLSGRSQLLIKASVVLILCAFIASAMGNIAHGAWVARGDMAGYFDGNVAGSCYDGGDGIIPQGPIVGDVDKCSASVLPHSPDNPWANQNAVPMEYIQSGPTNSEKAQRFFQYLKGSYESNGAYSQWQKTGSAFIVRQMLGFNSGSSRTITSAEWTELQNRLQVAANAGRIDFNKVIDNGAVPYYNGWNTYYQQTKNDIAYTPHRITDRVGIEITNSSGQPIFAIWYWCANPVGNLPGLESTPTWSISTSSSVKSISGTTSTNSAKIGSTVTWEHTIKNNGPNDTNKTVVGHYQNRVGASTNSATWRDVVVDETGLGGSLKSLAAGRCLDADTNTLSSGTTKVQQYDCSGQPQQLWRYDTSTKTIKTTANNSKCLNATGGSNNSAVNLVACNNSTQQKWDIDSSGSIKSVRYTNMCMDTDGDINGRASKLYGCLPSSHPSNNNQQWIKGTEGPDQAYGLIPPTHTRIFSSTYKVTAADVGRTLCRSTSATPPFWNGGGWTESSAACVTVPYDFDLVPSISTSTTIAQAGGVVGNITPTINNTGKTRTDRPSQWVVTKIIVSPTGSIATSLQTNNKAPCATYGNACTPVKSGSQDFPLGLTPLEILNSETIPENAPVGTKVCFALSVQPYKFASSDWRHGIPVCIVVAKSPKVQVLGGDLIVGRGTVSNDPRTSNVSTSTTYSPSTGLTYGSWSEYAIIPSGTVKGMASGALYVGGSASNNLCSLSILTISNSQTAGNVTTCIATSIGKFTDGTAAPNPASRFPVSKASVIPNTVTTQNIHALAPREVYTTTVANLTLTSSAEFEAGHWVVLNAPNTTVTIADNINYTTGPISGIGQIPQVVIIAKNIIIKDSVEKIDAWLVASGGALQGSGATSRSINDGVINTCGAGTGITTTTLPNSNQCNKTLTVNGPVMANHLLLRRTAGAGTGADSGDPAEVFNLRADAYIWASAYSPGNGRIPTVNTTELPPRF
jgi:hypothetical protein